MAFKKLGFKPDKRMVFKHIFLKKKRRLLYFHIKNGIKSVFLFYLRQRPTALFHQIGLSFLSQAATYRPVLCLIYKNFSDKASEISKRL